MNDKDNKIIINKVKEVVGLTLKIPDNKLNIEAGFDSFGIDSIVAMDLMKKLSKIFDTAITPAQFTAVNTIKELGDSIANIIGDATIIEKNVSHVVKDNKKINKEVIKTKKTRSIKQDSTPKSYIKSDRYVTRENSLNIKKLNKIREHIEKKYSIVLSNNQFDSVDDIVNELLKSHANELASHYELSNRTVVLDIEKKAEKKLGVKEGQNNDIAIVGLSCNFPDAPNATTFWNNLLSKHNSIKEIPPSRWKWQDYYSDSASTNKTISKWGAFIDHIDCFDFDFFDIPAEQAKLMDPQERILLQEVYKAFQDASIDVSGISGSNTSVFVGYEYTEYERYLRDHSSQIKESIIHSSASPTYYLANRLSYIFDFCGASESINANCASSAVAINRGCLSLLNKESNLAVASGVVANLFAEDYIFGSHYGMLSKDGTCGVFDDNANGFTRGEGVGAIILKRLVDAEKDNNKIYGVIKSCHQNNRGKANDISEIKHESITNVIAETYKRELITPETVDYIEVDGYCTKWGDSFEFEGIKNLFNNTRAQGKTCALGSLKGNIGHLEPASGIASTIKMALSLYNKKFPATISAKNLSSFIDIQDETHPLYIADATIPFEQIRKNENTPIRAGVNSFSDSGANVHILLEEYMDESVFEQNNELSRKELFVLSAKNNVCLEEYVQVFIDFLYTTDVLLTDMNYSLQLGREALQERVAIIAGSQKELLEKLILVKELGLKNQLKLEKQGIYHSDINQGDRASLGSLISGDMISPLLEENVVSEKWHDIAMFWINGATIPWKKYWDDKLVHSISLPGYPFAKEKCWINISDDDATVDASHSKSEFKAVVDLTNQTEWLFSNATSDLQNTCIMEASKKIELFIKQEIAFQLKAPIKSIAMDINFIELGLSSLGITGLIQKLNSLLSERLSPSIVFKYRDIQKMAAFMLETCADKIELLTVTKKEVNTELLDEKDTIDMLEDRTLLTNQGQKLLDNILLEDNSDTSNYEVVTF
jgi:3-oxoacyl-(acyl-carrier-protein) synthase/acyl carrier protein